MKGIVLRIAAAFVSAAAAIIRLFVKQEDMILLISCQGDEPSQDILDLAAAIGEMNEPVRVDLMAGRMDRSAIGAFSFAGKLLSMLKHIAAARVVVLDAYCPAVSIPGKPQGQTVVQMWHAPEAIKKFSLQVTDTPAGYDSQTVRILKMHRNYDYILCPADATRPFFEEAFGYPDSAFVKYGQPSLDRIGRIRRPEHDNEGHEGPLTIVYAPTFRDGAEVDFDGLVRAFEKAGPDVTIVLKPHPLDTISIIPKDSTVVKDSALPLIDWYAAADIVITDYSGVAVDAAAAGVASYYYIYDIDEYKKERGLNVDIRNEATGKYAFEDADELAGQVFRDFSSDSGPQYDYQALNTFRDKYLEVPLSGNKQNLAGLILEMVK